MLRKLLERLRGVEEPKTPATPPAPQEETVLFSLPQGGQVRVKQNTPERMALAMEKLDEEHRARFRQVMGWSLAKQAQHSAKKGRLFANVMHQEITTIAGEFPKALEKAEGCDAVYSWVRERKGEAWPLVASEDELRLTAHEFWLDWTQKEHDA